MYCEGEIYIQRTSDTAPPVAIPGCLHPKYITSKMEKIKSKNILGLIRNISTYQRKLLTGYNTISV